VKIHDPYLSGAAASQLQQTQQPATVSPAGSEQESKSAAASDSVGLSELSVRLLELARTESPERVVRLERLAADIRSGRYQVDPLALSRRIVDATLQGD